jgi:hypothetical protein
MKRCASDFTTIDKGSLMPHVNVPGGNSPGARKPRIAAAVAALIACIGLAACGGSSKGTSTSANAASATSTAQGAPTGPTSPGGAPGAAGGRFKAVRECLQKNGITLPQPTPGTRRPPGAGGLLGAGKAPQLPAGVTRAQYEAALKKCGGGAGGRGALGGGAARFRSPAAKQALAKFATCMRENGVKVPEPNTSGNGPVFNTTGLNTASAQFKKAQEKCGAALNGLARRPGAGAGPGGAAGAPGGTAPSQQAP